MATYVQKGFGQVEANRLSAMVNGEMEAQAPAYTDANGTTAISELTNGMFLVVVPDKGNKSARGRVAVLPKSADAKAIPMMVYCEKKLYDERDSYSDFVLKADKEVDGVIVPRLFNISVGGADVFTTNNIAEAGSLAVGDKLYVGDNGYLVKTQATNKAIMFVVTKLTTMPDGQKAVTLIAQNVA